ncbi:MAG: DUF3592 domain-containing protein [Thermoanaerobaculia bacterium]
MLQRLSSPPRRVPLSLRTLATFNIVTQVGLVFATFGSFFFWVFAPNADLSFFNFRGLSEAQGYVTRVEKTNASENRARVRANHYTYSVAGRRFDGTSYSSGNNVDPGQTVTVEYKTSDPEQSRIAGQRRKLFGPVVLIVLIFPFFGLLIAAGGIAYGRGQTRLLKNGEVTGGTVITREKRPGRTTSEHVIYEFKTRDGVKRQRKRTVYETTPLNERLLLYDPQKPDDADLLDTSITADGTNELQPRAVAALLSLILPAIFVASNLLASRILVGR